MNKLTIKYLVAIASKNIKIGDQVELDETKAKSLIEDGLAEEVKATDDSSLEASQLAIKSHIEKTIEDGVALAVKKAMDLIAKGYKPSNQISVGADRDLLDPQGGFKGMTHFLREVKQSGIGITAPTATMKSYFELENRRIKTAGATPYASEGTPSLTAGTGDGAVIPVQYVGEIFRMYGEQDDLMSMAFPFAMNSLSAHLPVLRNYDHSNSTAANGVVVSEPGEGNKIPLSKTNWEQRLFTLVKEGIIVPVSNEALDDNNVGLGTAIAAQAVWQLRKKINGGIVQGSSVTSSCVGIIGGAATKIVGRGTAGTVIFNDLVAMYAAFAHQDANYGGAYWLVHPTALQAITSSTIGSFPAMLTPGAGQTGQPLSILGRPIIVTGWAKTLGTSGDVLLFDPKRYIMGFKGGVNSFVSPHIYADSDQTGFRFTQRVNGQQGLTGLITLEDGSTTVSPFVELGQVGGLS